MPNAAKAAAALLALATLQFAGASALAQVLYKWIDADGKVQYSDQPPKGYNGPVTRIEPDVAATPTPAPPPAKEPATPAAAPAKAPPAQDMAGKRRAVRTALEARLVAARDKLDAARRALADAPSPGTDERQVVQQQMKAGQGGMHGLSAKRSNCRPVVDKNGKAGVMCPALLPNDAYYERIAKLEAAIKEAEQELADAEEAWRRGVD